MGKPILYYHEASPPSRAVALLCRAIELDVEISIVDVAAKSHKTPEYLKMNPTGTFPTLDDNGVYIYESHVIMIYLMAKYSKSDELYPKDIVQRSKIDSILYVETALIFGRYRAVAEVIFFGNPPEVPQFLLDNLTDSLKKVESILDHSGGNFLAGEKLSIADISCLHSLGVINSQVPITADKYPKIVKWFQTMYDLYPGVEEKEKNSHKILAAHLERRSGNRAQ